MILIYRRNSKRFKSYLYRNLWCLLFNCANSHQWEWNTLFNFHMQFHWSNISCFIQMLPLYLLLLVSLTFDDVQLLHFIVRLHVQCRRSISYFKKRRYFHTSVECLVEQHMCLESWNKRKPWKKHDWGEHK